MEASLSDCHNSALQQRLHSDLQSTKICQEEHTLSLDSIFFSLVAKLQNTLPLVCTLLNNKRAIVLRYKSELCYNRTWDGVC